MSGLPRSGWVHAMAGFLAMGGWAALANRTHPFPAPVLAGLVQGSLSALITLGLKRTVEVLSAGFRGRVGLILPPVTACLISASLLSLVHTLAGTPERLATIALPLCVATTYATLYTLSLRRSQKGPNHEQAR